MTARTLFGIVTLAIALAASMPAAAVDCPTGCDDANPCTNDVCDATQGCVHTNNAAPCNDGNACTTGDVCSGGACVGGDTATGCTACQAVANIPAAGGTFSGTTRGASTLSGSCGTSGVSPERVYRWTPATSGTVTLSTCGSATGYDTVVYLRAGSCTGTQVGCNDDGPCATSSDPGEGSRLVAAVTAGQAYYIVVDGWGGESGAFALSVVAPASSPAVCGNNIREGAEICDGTDVAACPSGACTTSCTCVPVASGLPDLVAEITDSFFQFGTTVDPGDVAEGCAAQQSGVDLLRFGVLVRNLGTAELFFGDPMCPSSCATHPDELCGNPLFECSPAGGHNHGHYRNWASYDLVNPTNQSVVVSGTSRAFASTTVSTQDRARTGGSILAIFRGSASTAATSTSRRSAASTSRSPTFLPATTSSASPSIR